MRVVGSMAAIFVAPGYQPTAGGLQEVARTLNGYQAARRVWAACGRSTGAFFDITGVEVLARGAVYVPAWWRPEHRQTERECWPEWLEPIECELPTEAGEYNATRHSPVRGFGAWGGETRRPRECEVIGQEEKPPAPHEGTGGLSL